MKRILWNHGGEDIDEIVIDNCSVHIEQMEDRCWWIGIELADGGWWAGNFHCYRHRDGMHFTEQERDGFEWDRDEEHL